MIAFLRSTAGARARILAAAAAGAATMTAIAVIPRLDAGPAPAAQARALGLTAPGRQLDFSLVLRLHGVAALRRFLAGAADPRSPGYGHFITPSRFGARFGLSSNRLRRLRAALRSRGLEVVSAYPQRTALEVRARASTLEALFAIQLRNHVDARGRSYYAPTRPPHIPRWLGGDVVAVTGLDTRPVIIPADVPAGGLAPRTLARAYDTSPLRAAGIDGAGQTIAIVSFDSFAHGDLASYERHFAIGGPHVQQVNVDGGTTPGAGQSEVDLDVDTIRAIAPGAQVIDYEAPLGTGSLSDVINRIVADGRAKIISNSWGRCDLALPAGARIADEHALAAARAAGISVFAASGDSGAYDCQRADFSDHRPSVDWPAASDNVVAVGGTRLSVRKNGSYLGEYGWEDVLAGAGSGGGLASATARPPWQRGPGVANANSNGQRQVPDVAGPADPASGMVVFERGGFNEIGGTSAAAPFWAAAFALIREYAARHGAHDLGFVAPLLYRVAAHPATASAFHEPVAGGNRKYAVVPGWNYVTGLGSPDVAALARALARLAGGH